MAGRGAESFRHDMRSQEHDSVHWKVPHNRACIRIRIRWEWTGCWLRLEGFEICMQRSFGPLLGMIVGQFTLPHCVAPSHSLSSSASCPVFPLIGRGLWCSNAEYKGGWRETSILEEVLRIRRRIGTDWASAAPSPVEHGAAYSPVNSTCRIRTWH